MGIPIEDVRGDKDENYEQSDEGDKSEDNSEDDSRDGIDGGWCRTQQNAWITTSSMPQVHIDFPLFSNEKEINQYEMSTDEAFSR